MTSKGKMKILYIWDADYPWDVRVEKICTSLMKNDNEVYIAARNLKKLPEYENMDGLHVYRLKSYRNNKINYAFSFPAFFSPFWKRFIDTIINNHGIQLIVVRDLPMALAGIWAGQRHEIPVILDMAEDYVALVRNVWRARKFQGLNLLVRNPYLATFVERYVFKNIDHILVVVNEAVDVVVRGGSNPAKVTIVGNTPSLTAFNNSDIQMNNDIRMIKKRFSAIYTGGIQLGRGIQTVLAALPEIVKEIPDFLFVVVGDGYATEQLKKMIQENQLDDYVLWVGWIDRKKIFDYIKVSKLGLIPHFVSDHVNTTIPNKLFDYMGCGIPVISSDAIPMKRILEEERCGITFKNGDPKDLARVILEIHKNDNDFGQHGIDAVRNIYNWEEDSNRLLKVVYSFSEIRHDKD
jgi:glycosyltransferase involved in cell wall biosynthesis